MTLDWQLAVVALAVLASAGYVAWRVRATFATEDSGGSCEGCEQGQPNENAPKIKPLVQLQPPPKR